MIEKQRLDETIPGGAYIKNGVVVDAEGKTRDGWTVVDGVATPLADKSKKSLASAPDTDQKAN